MIYEEHTCNTIVSAVHNCSWSTKKSGNPKNPLTGKKMEMNETTLPYNESKPNLNVHWKKFYSRDRNLNDGTVNVQLST